MQRQDFPLSHWWKRFSHCLTGISQVPAGVCCHAPLKNLTPPALLGNPLLKTSLLHAEQTQLSASARASSAPTPSLSLWLPLDSLQFVDVLSKSGHSSPNAVLYHSAYNLLIQLSMKPAAFAARARCCLMSHMWSTRTSSSFPGKLLSVCLALACAAAWGCSIPGTGLCVCHC